MNYQANLNKFEKQLEKETTKLFKLHEQNKDIIEIENQTEIVKSLINIVDSLKNLI
ncbi:hypothetical protein VL10_ORF13 [Staphylococcus phage vB_SauM_VL10]|nr:hypothetical protein VL10_ORF13 [Staphylococcus phage vB_SauM_VL10]